MEYTTNYQLPTWVKEDRIMMVDFNNMTEKLDMAMAGFGNCRIFSASYVGTGGFNVGSPCSFTFPGRPLVGFIVDSEEAYLLFFSHGMEESLCLCREPCDYHLTWAEDEGGCTMGWYISSMYASAKTQANVNGRTYYIYALLAADA